MPYEIPVWSKIRCCYGGIFLIIEKSRSSESSILFEFRFSFSFYPLSCSLSQTDYYLLVVDVPGDDVILIETFLVYKSHRQVEFLRQYSRSPGSSFVRRTHDCLLPVGNIFFDPSEIRLQFIWLSNKSLQIMMRHVLHFQR